MLALLGLRKLPGPRARLSLRRSLAPCPAEEAGWERHVACRRTSRGDWEEHKEVGSGVSGQAGSFKHSKPSAPFMVMTQGDRHCCHPVTHIREPRHQNICGWAVVSDLNQVVWPQRPGGACSSRGTDTPAPAIAQGPSLLPPAQPPPGLSRLHP